MTEGFSTHEGMLGTLRECGRKGTEPSEGVHAWKLMLGTMRMENESPSESHAVTKCFLLLLLFCFFVRLVGWLFFGFCFCFEMGFLSAALAVVELAL